MLDISLSPSLIHTPATICPVTDLVIEGCNSSVSYILGELTNPLFKQYYDLLWRILGYLPPSSEFLENMNTYNETTHLLHLFRFEKKIINDKHITDFLSKEITFKDIQWFKNINQKTSFII